MALVLRSESSDFIAQNRTYMRMSRNDDCGIPWTPKIIDLPLELSQRKMSFFRFWNDC